MTAWKLTKVHRDVTFVAMHWPDLVEARLPGTPRRWVQTRSRAESRRHATSAGVSALAGLSKAKAPEHLDVLDTITDVVAVSRTLADAVAQLADVEQLGPPRSAYTDPRPYLTLVSDHLDDAALADGGWLLDAALDDRDDASIVRARRRTAAALQLTLGGQVLDADCPWCRARPLRIRIVADEPLVVCESRRVCEPPEADCGTWVRDRPAWIQPEWEWLARRIRHADDRVLAG